MVTWCTACCRLTGISESAPLKDPCLPSGMQDKVDYQGSSLHLLGTGNLAMCQDRLLPLLNLSTPCSKVREQQILCQIISCILFHNHSCVEIYNYYILLYLCVHYLFLGTMLHQWHLSATDKLPEQWVLWLLRVLLHKWRHTKNLWPLWLLQVYQSSRGTVLHLGIVKIYIIMEFCL